MRNINIGIVLDREAVLNNTTVRDQLIDFVTTGMRLNGREGEVVLEFRGTALPPSMRGLPVSSVLLWETMDGFLLPPGHHDHRVTGASADVESMTRGYDGQPAQRINVSAPTFDQAYALYLSVRQGRQPESPFLSAAS